MEENALVQPRLPRLGEPVPSFEAETTMGIIHLEDFAGLLEPAGENFRTTDKGNKALEGSVKV